MDVLRQIPDLSGLDRPLHLAIGVFDGVHLGHQAVISTAVRGAEESGGEPVIVTFDPHPVTVLRPEMRPRLLTNTRHKLALAKELGVSRALVISFDDVFARQTASEFVDCVVESCQDLRQICVGAGWRFGCDRAGDLNLLQSLGETHGFQVDGMKTVMVGGEPVSSTAIRQAVQEGELKHAAKLLGRDYTVLGTVVEGNKLGRTLGFPTANLMVYNEQLPPSGVYVLKVKFRGQTYGGVGNLGLRPTVENEEGERRLEVHIFDLESDEFYGEELEACFLEFLRPEQRFENLEALTAQVHSDMDRARSFFQG